MAKTVGPLFSMQAHGQLGKTITYFEQSGRSMATSITPPKKKKTAKQLAQQDNFSDGQDAWNDLTEEEQQAWEDKADEWNEDHPPMYHRSGRCMFASNYLGG